MTPTEQAAAYCAAHEGAQATGTCERCGNYVCPLCLDPASDHPAQCAACRDRSGADVMAWERPDGGWPKRWASTVRDLLVRPGETFRRTRPGPWHASIAFNALTAFLMGAVFTLVLGCGLVALIAIGVGPDVLGEVRELGAERLGIGLGVAAGVAVFYPLIFVLWALLFQAGVVLVYHLTAIALGGKGNLATSTWAVGYLSVAQLAHIPIGIVSNFPIVGPLIGLLAWLAIGAWASWHLTTVARHHHELEGARAAFAGWSPLLLATALTLGCCLFFVVLGFSRF